MIASIILVISILFFGLIVLIFTKDKSYESVKIITAFLITMLATFMGVYLAFELSEYQHQNEGKEELEANINRTLQGLEYEMQSMDVLLYFSNNTDVRIIDDNPITELPFLNLLAADTKLPIYGSVECTGAILKSIMRLNNIRPSINDNNETPIQRKYFLKVYSNEIKYVTEVLKLELIYLHEGMTKEEFNKIHQDLINKNIQENDNIRSNQY